MSLNGWRQPKGGRWRLEVPRLSGPIELRCATIAKVLAGLGLLLVVPLLDQVVAWGIMLPFVGTVFSWPDVGQEEGNITGSRVADQIRRHLGLSSYSLPAARDAALAELLASHQPVFNVKAFGAVGDGVTDDTAAIQLAIDTAPDGGTVAFPVTTSGYKVTGITVDKPLHIVGVAPNLAALGSTISAPSAARLIAAGAQSYVAKFGAAVADVADIQVGLTVENILFHGNNAAMSDALVVGEGFSEPHFINCGFHNATGNGVRLREWFEGIFDRCYFRNIDAGASGKAVVYIDDRYNSDSLLNVNNLNFFQCHLERNEGTYFFSHQTSNLDILRITHTKFEWGLDGVPSDGPWPLFELRGGFRVRISHNHFANFNAANKYDKILRLGHASTLGGNTIFTQNDFSGTDGSTYLFSGITGARAIVRDNTAFDHANATFLIENTSNGGPVLIERPYKTADTAAPGTAADTRLVSFPSRAPGLISIHEIFSANTSANPFSAEAGVKNSALTAISGDGANEVLAQLPAAWLYDLPGAVRIGIRCKSASGAGTISMQVNTTSLTDQTVPSSFDVLWFEISQALLAVLGDNGSDRFRIRTGAANAEAVYVDGIYVLPMDHHYSGSATYDPPSLADGAGATTTVTVTGAALGDFANATFSLDLQGITLTAWVSATNTVSVRFQNESGGLLDLDSGTLRVRVSKP